MITLTSANFFDKFQQIIEKYYLKPLNGSHKENLKDGSIERTIHGAQHASRAALWAFIMNKLLQKLTRNQVDESLKTIANHINVDVDTLILITLITVACHDAARQGEGKDIWEKQSAEITLELLTKLGLEEQHARLIAAAVEFKDNLSGYQKILGRLGIREKDYNKFGYIRVLVNLGDNLDLMRCTGKFNSQYVFKTLESVDGFKEDQHEIVIQLMQEIHQFIYDSADMLFDCTLQDAQGNTLARHKSHFSKKEKVKYEHAENVFVAVFADALKNPLFNEYLKDFTVPKAVKYEGEVAFDPFLHGTNTTIFSMLSKTSFQMMPIFDMLDRFQVAPLSGELTEGGYARVGGAVFKEERFMGKTSFGRLSAEGENSYTLKKILSQYANKPHTTNKINMDLFNEMHDQAFDHAFSNINLLMITFVRARQMSATLDDVIQSNDLRLLRQKMHATIQFYYFMQLLGTHIHPNYKAIEQSEMEKTVSDLVYEKLTFQEIVNKIIAKNINMQEIVENPTQENLNIALSVLELPKKRPVRQGKEIELVETQFFCLESNYPETFQQIYNYDPKDYFSRLAKNQSSPYCIHDALSFFLQKNLKPELFKSLGEHAKQHIVLLKDRIALFEQLIVTTKQLELTSAELYFLHKKYPLILLSEEENKIQLYNLNQDEYRSNTALELGSDIKIIATDTHEHRLEIMKYLELNQIHSVHVILFSELEQAKKERKRPSTSYYHPDGIPTLKWLAAKKIMSTDPKFYQQHSSKLITGIPDTSQVYSDHAIQQAKDILQDAEHYQQIGFEADLPKQNPLIITSSFFVRKIQEEVHALETATDAHSIHQENKHDFKRKSDVFLSEFTKKHHDSYRSGFLNGFFNRTVYKSPQDYTLHKILAHAKERTLFGFKNRTCKILEEMGVLDANGTIIDRKYGIN